jgi:RNA polymerase sigma-70 factor (ECF subfamily)
MSSPPPPCFEIERYRPLLLLQVRQLQLDPRLQPRFDSSDLVHIALTQAIERFPQFKGNTEGELVRWLQTILSNTVINQIRAHQAGIRDVRMERSIQAAVDQSSARVEQFLVDNGQTDPGERVARQELLVRLGEAVDQLREEQREVFIRRHLMDFSIVEIADQLNKTRGEVAGLLFRAVRQLRQLLHAEGSEEGN